MYKVSKVAEMLSVEKVKIFEALIVHDNILTPYVTKERHVSYISKSGVREIERIIFNTNDTREKVENHIILDNEKKNLEEENPEEEKTEEEESEEDQLDKLIIDCENKKSIHKKEIIDLRRQLNLLDNDIRHKSDAIINYQDILNDDLAWLIKLEAKVDAHRTKAKVIGEGEQKKLSFLGKFIK